MLTAETGCNALGGCPRIPLQSDLLQRMHYGTLQLEQVM